MKRGDPLGDWLRRTDQALRSSRMYERLNRWLDPAWLWNQMVSRLRRLLP